MKILSILIVLAAAAVSLSPASLPLPAAAAAAPPSCSPMAPTPVMTAVFDDKPARYSLPESNAPEPGYFLDAKGATTIYQDVGTLEGHLCPGSDVDWWFTQTGYVKHEPPTCWVLEPVKISECPAPAPAPEPAP